MMLVERIIKSAKALGACRLTEGVTDISSLVRLFLTPQGREFCLEYNFPSMNDWLQLKAHHISESGIFCDYGRVHVSDGQMYVGVGKTALEANFTENNSVNHTVVLMRGASAKIRMSNYAVVKVEKTDDCKVEIINEDNTGIVLW